MFYASCMSPVFRHSQVKVIYVWTPNAWLKIDGIEWQPFIKNPQPIWCWSMHIPYECGVITYNVSIYLCPPPLHNLARKVFKTILANHNWSSGKGGGGGGGGGVISNRILYGAHNLHCPNPRLSVTNRVDSVLEIIWRYFCCKNMFPIFHANVAPILNSFIDRNVLNLVCNELENTCKCFHSRSDKILSDKQ